MRFWSTGKPILLLSTLAVTAAFVLAVAGDDATKKKDDKAPQPSTQAAKPAPKPEPKAAGSAVPATAAASASPATPGSPTTYTNDDLKRMFGEAPSGSASTDSTRSPEPEKAAGGKEEAPARTALQQLEEQQKLQGEKLEKIAEAEKAVAAAEQRVADLERRGLAVRNPYLKRPNVSEEENKDWDKLGTAERAQRTDEDLKKARDDAEAARRALEELRHTP